MGSAQTPDVDPVTQRLDELADEMPPALGARAGRALIDAGAWAW